MKRLLLVLSTVAASALFAYFLLPNPRAAGPDGAPLQTPGHAPAPESTTAPKADDQALEHLKAARLEAEERVRELQGKLDEAQKAKVQSLRKRPFADPEMKKVMTKEADAGAERSVTALLDAGLSADLQLNDEQEAQLRSLLEERGGIGLKQILIPLGAGELEGERLAAAGRRTREAYAQNTAQIRALLGNEGYATYEWYEKTQLDRDTVQRLSPQFARAGQSLTAEQESDLVALFTNERAGFRFEHDFTDPAKIDYERFHELFNAENSERHFRETQRFHDQVAQRAASMLNPEQQKLLQGVLAAHVQRSKLTVQTTRAMMGQTE